MPTTLELMKEVAATQGIAGVDFREPSHHMLIANDLRFHYVDWGGTGFPILFLHGGGQTCRTWDMVCLQLREKYRCYALDQRNHGDSEKTSWTDSGFTNQRLDIRGVIEALGLEDFAIVGMSMGGLNTMAYASEYHDGLRAVTLVDVTPTTHYEGAREIGHFSRPREFASVEAALEEAKKFNPLRPPVHLHYSLLHSLRQRPDGKWVWKHERIGPVPTDQQAGTQEEGITRRFEVLWNEVPKISCPTLIIHGRESKVIHREDAERLAKAIPEGEVVTIPGAGHTVQGDKPKEFVAELRKFLDRVL